MSASTKTPSKAKESSCWQSRFSCGRAPQSWQFVSDMLRNSPSTSIKSRSCSDIMLLAFLRTQPETAPCQEGVWLHRTTASHQHADYADDAAASECASRHLAVAVQGSAAKGAGLQAALRHTTKAPVRFIGCKQARPTCWTKSQAGLQQQEHGWNQQARCWAYGPTISNSRAQNVDPNSGNLEFELLTHAPEQGSRPSTLDPSLPLELQKPIQDLL